MYKILHCHIDLSRSLLKLTIFYMIPHKIGVLQSGAKEKLYYTRENWKYFLDGKEIDSVPITIAFEFERADRNYDDMMNMNGKVVKVSYTEKDWYFLSYEWEDWIVIIPPLSFTH